MKNIQNDPYSLGPATQEALPKKMKTVTEYYPLEEPTTREQVMHVLETCVADSGVSAIEVKNSLVTVTRRVPEDFPEVPGPTARGLNEENVEYAIGNIELTEIIPTNQPLHDLLRAGKVLTDKQLVPRFLLIPAGDTDTDVELTLRQNTVLGMSVYRTNNLSEGAAILVGVPTYRCDIISAEFGVRITTHAIEGGYNGRTD